MDDHDPSSGPDTVADAEWARVRRLAERVTRLEEASAERDGDEEIEARLARARIRAGRAAERALLADELANELARLGRTSG